MVCRPNQVSLHLFQLLTDILTRTFYHYTEINIYDIDINDRFIIIASDGVWEFLSNDQVAQLALPFYAAGHAEQAANTIVREAAKTWKEREDVVDDITCVVVFMDIKLVEKSLRFKETNK